MDALCGAGPAIGGRGCGERVGTTAAQAEAAGARALGYERRPARDAGRDLGEGRGVLSRAGPGGPPTYAGSRARWNACGGAHVREPAAARTRARPARGQVDGGTPLGPGRAGGPWGGVSPNKRGCAIILAKHHGRMGLPKQRSIMLVSGTIFGMAASRLDGFCVGLRWM